jgi:hypothetical protein
MKTKTILAAFLLLIPIFSFAWGAEGHKIVADIAKKKLNAGIEAKVQKYLDSTSFEQAATWMDEVRSDHSYDYMKPWHYVNIEKGGAYVKNPKGDVVCELDSVIGRLRKYKTMNAVDVKKDLKILFHLCGDIAQPLHAGYGSDKGGNDIELTYLDKKSNLHHVWDTDIITSENITADVALQSASAWTADQLKTIQKIDPMAWMNDSRSFLPQVYNFQNATITQDYVNANKITVENQLAKGGLRLAAVLNEIFAGK